MDPSMYGAPASVRRAGTREAIRTRHGGAYSPLVRVRRRRGQHSARRRILLRPRHQDVVRVIEIIESWAKIIQQFY